MLEEELGRMSPDLSVIEEWKRKDADYASRLRDLETATAARNQVLLQVSFPGKPTNCAPCRNLMMRRCADRFA